MKSLLKKVLRILTKLIIRKHRPFIIGVTGSVGKTSTKDALITVLKHGFRVQPSLKNYNNEIGLPLTVMGELSPGRSAIGWIRVILKGIRLSLVRDKAFPQLLVLEYAADRKGDIAYLRTMIPPTIAVITHVSAVHQEFFESVEDIAHEKFNLIKHLDSHGDIYINGDAPPVVSYAKNLSNKKFITYGFSDDAHIRALRVRLRFDRANPLRPIGSECTVRMDGESLTIFLPGVISDAHIYSVLPAIAIAYMKDIPLHTIVEALKQYHVPRGRMKLIMGIKGSLIIDDTYNASPIAVINALDTIHKLPLANDGHKWACLGDMLELGSIATHEHRGIGRHLFTTDIEYLVTVGPLAKFIAKGAMRRGMPKDNIFSFDDTSSAGKFIQGRIATGDILLVKGSQSSRMEKVVEELMADPLRAKELLVRQDSSWQ